MTPLNEMHDQFLKQLLQVSLDYLLQTLNNIWITNDIPKSRKRSYQYPNLTKTIQNHQIMVPAN